MNKFNINIIIIFSTFFWDKSDFLSSIHTFNYDILTHNLIVWIPFINTGFLEKLYLNLKIDYGIETQHDNKLFNVGLQRILNKLFIKFFFKKKVKF